MLFYFYKHSYVIEQFTKVVKRSLIDSYDFVYTEIGNGLFIGR